MKGQRKADDTRERIMTLVREQPGIHKHALCRTLGLAWGTISHHVYVLRSRGQLRTSRRGRQLLLYVAEVPDHQQAWLRALRDPLDAHILASLQDHPRARAADVSRHVGANVKLVRRHLLGLQEEGLVRRVETAQPRYLLVHHDGAIAITRRPRAAAAMPGSADTPGAADRVDATEPQEGPDRTDRTTPPLALALRARLGRERAD